MKSSAQKQAATAPRKYKKGKIRENIEALVIAVLLALFIRAFVVQAFKIPSGSMQDTLLIGDQLLVNKFIYGVKLPFTNTTLIPFKEPQRGEIIVFKYPQDPSKDFIKRVVGVAGDTVEIRNKQVFVNGFKQPDDFAVHVDPRVFPRDFQPRDNFGPVTVPADKLFVMGDNRDESNDSRYWGFVGEDAVIGRAILIYWSWDSQKFNVRWHRIGHMIH